MAGKKRGGGTWIKWIVVVAIIAVLAVFALPNIISTIQGGNDGRGQSASSGDMGAATVSTTGPPAGAAMKP